jgi:hypothetical protein
MLSKDLEIIKRNDIVYTLTFTDSDGVIDISQWTIYFAIKIQNSAAALISKEITEHSDPTHGVSKIPLTHDDTAINRGVYKYLISVKTGAGEIYSILAGKLSVMEY